MLSIGLYKPLSTVWTLSDSEPLVLLPESLSLQRANREEKIRDVFLLVNHNFPGHLNRRPTDALYDLPPAFFATPCGGDNPNIGHEGFSGNKSTSQIHQSQRGSGHLISLSNNSFDQNLKRKHPNEDEDDGDGASRSSMKRTNYQSSESFVCLYHAHGLSDYRLCIKNRFKNFKGLCDHLQRVHIKSLQCRTCKTRSGIVADLERHEAGCFTKGGISVPNLVHRRVVDFSNRVANCVPGDIAGLEKILFKNGMKQYDVLDGTDNLELRSLPNSTDTAATTLVSPDRQGDELHYPKQDTSPSECGNFMPPGNTEMPYSATHLYPDQQATDILHSAFPNTWESYGSVTNSIGAFTSRTVPETEDFCTEQEITSKKNTPPNPHNVGLGTYELPPPPSPPSLEVLEEMYPHLIGQGKLISKVAKQLNLVEKHATLMAEPLARHFISLLTPTMAESIREIVADSQRERKTSKDPTKPTPPPQQCFMRPPAQRITNDPNTEASSGVGTIYVSQAMRKPRSLQPGARTSIVGNQKAYDSNHPWVESETHPPPLWKSQNHVRMIQCNNTDLQNMHSVPDDGETDMNRRSGWLE